MRIGLAVASGLLLCGCAHQIPAGRFDKPGGTQATFLQDRFDCMKQAEVHRTTASASMGGALLINRGLFLACMNARGYIQSEDGPFAAPPGSEVGMIG